MPKVSRLEVIQTGARRRWTLEDADSDDFARGFRFDLAHPSDLMSPGVERRSGVAFLASAQPRGQS
jgi:hypothetical protein